MITLILALTLTVALTVAYGVWDERNRRAEYARLAAMRPTPSYLTPGTTAYTLANRPTRPLKGRRAGAAHPTDAPRTTPGRHTTTGRHAAPVATAPVMTTPTASGRVRSVHTGKLVSAYVAGVLATPLPHHCTVPAVPGAAPRHNRPTRAKARPVVNPWLTVA